MFLFLAAPACLAAVAAMPSGCGGGTAGREIEWGGGEGPLRVGTGALAVLWNQQLTDPVEGPYVPVERARAALDPRGDRIYVGSTAGALYAMTSGGRRLYRFDAEGAIESAPALDRASDVLYVATEQGAVYALRASDGQPKWTVHVDGPVRHAPVLSTDALYVVTDTDIVVALARADGAELWRYRREAAEGFSVSGHAGLVLLEGRLFTASTDGVVVALDAIDGRVVWDRDTTVDLEFSAEETTRLLDVDTTPVVIGDTLYVASFAGGLYALELANGSVKWRDAELRGVVALAAAGDTDLVIASVESGIRRMSVRTRESTWNVAHGRTTPSDLVVDGDAVFVSETPGALVVLKLASGRELARVEAGTGFSSAPAIAAGFGVVVSNGGALYAFAAGR